MDPKNDEYLAALSRELADLYLKTNGFDPARGTYDAAIVSVVDHAIAYAFKIGYRTRVWEERTERAQG